MNALCCVCAFSIASSTEMSEMGGGGQGSHAPPPDFSRSVNPRGTSIQGEVRNVEKKRVTQQLLCSKSHDFLAVFALAHSKINKIA